MINYAAIQSFLNRLSRRLEIPIQKREVKTTCDREVESGIYIINLFLKKGEKRKHYYYVGQSINIFARVWDHFIKGSPQYVDQVIEQALHEWKNGKYELSIVIDFVFCEEQHLNFTELINQEIYAEELGSGGSLNVAVCGLQKNRPFVSNPYYETDRLYEDTDRYIKCLSVAAETGNIDLVIYLINLGTHPADVEDCLNMS